MTPSTDVQAEEYVRETYRKFIAGDYSCRWPCERAPVGNFGHSTSTNETVRIMKPPLMFTRSQRRS